MKEKPIGVFDSGVGGLTVVKQLQEYLPNEDIIYFGDAARVPYGTKSHDVIRHYSVQDATFLVEQGVKCIVVACNTASAHGIRDIRNRFPDIPVIGMIESGAAYAVQQSKSKHIAVIGTSATISSDLYATHLSLLDEQVVSYSKACPLFVPLVEEALSLGQVAESVVHHYLNGFIIPAVDTLILGCTHYPLLREVIQNYVGPSVYLVDSGKAAATYLKNCLNEQNLLRQKENRGDLHCYLSCVTPNFEKIASMCLKHEIEKLDLVDIEKIKI